MEGRNTDWPEGLPRWTQEQLRVLRGNDEEASLLMLTRLWLDGKISRRYLGQPNPTLSTQETKGPLSLDETSKAVTRTVEWIRLLDFSDRIESIAEGTHLDRFKERISPVLLGSTPHTKSDTARSQTAHEPSWKSKVGSRKLLREVDSKFKQLFIDWAEGSLPSADFQSEMLLETLLHKKEIWADYDPNSIDQVTFKLNLELELRQLHCIYISAAEYLVDHKVSEKYGRLETLDQLRKLQGLETSRRLD